MKKFLILLLFIFATDRASLFANTEKALRKKELSKTSLSFSDIVKENFEKWDKNGDGSLSPEEIQKAVANPKFKDETAAAIAAIELITRDARNKLPRITKEYLASNPSVEKSSPDAETDSTKTTSFQKRYIKALERIRNTSRELFPQSLPAFEAVHQGLGDCPFISTVGALIYRDAANVKSMFVENGPNSTVVNFGNGQTVKINRLTDADIGIWSSAGTNGLWLTVLEKAYRRALAARGNEAGSIYDKQPSVDTIEILDGRQTKRIDFKNESKLNLLRKELHAALNEKRIIKITTGAKHPVPGIPHEHAFAILGYDRKTDIVHIWNPWGNDFTPDGSEGFKNGYARKQGNFYLPLDQMPKIFTAINIETKKLVDPSQGKTK